MYVKYLQLLWMVHWKDDDYNTTSHFLQDKTQPSKHHPTATHHNPMLLYMKQQSQRIHARMKIYAYSYFSVLRA